MIPGVLVVLCLIAMGLPKISSAFSYFVKSETIVSCVVGSGVNFLIHVYRLVMTSVTLQAFGSL